MEQLLFLYIHFFYLSFSLPFYEQQDGRYIPSLDEYKHSIYNIILQLSINFFTNNNGGKK